MVWYIFTVYGLNIFFQNLIKKYFVRNDPLDHQLRSPSSIFKHYLNPFPITQL